MGIWYICWLTRAIGALLKPYGHYGAYVLLLKIYLLLSYLIALKPLTQVPSDEFESSDSSHPDMHSGLRLSASIQGVLVSTALKHAFPGSSQVVCKFPPETVREHSEILLLPLVTRLVNDQSPKCRAAVGGVLCSLLCQLAPQQLDQLSGYADRWLRGDSPQMRRAAAQVGLKGGARRQGVFMLF